MRVVEFGGIRTEGEWKCFLCEKYQEQVLSIPGGGSFYCLSCLREAIGRGTFTLMYGRISDVEDVGSATPTTDIQQDTTTSVVRNGLGDEVEVVW